jgi:hypothetical protein
MTAFIGASLTATYTAAQLTGSESGKAPGVGDRYVDNAGKIYRFVQYDTGAGGIGCSWRRRILLDPDRRQRHAHHGSHRWC